MTHCESTQDAAARLRRELEEKDVELVKEDKRRKADVENAITAGKEETEHALRALSENHAQRIKALEMQQQKKEENLKNQYEEKLILFGSSSSSVTPVCTVSEAQLKQSLAEAKEEIKALKEQVKDKVKSVRWIVCRLPALTWFLQP